MKIFFKTIIIIILFFFIGYNMSFCEDGESTVTQKTKKYSYKIFPVDDGYGFNISNQGKIFIYQEHIPAINGYANFETKNDAKKIALLMIHKIENNIFPPSISSKDVDSLKVIIP